MAKLSKRARLIREKVDVLKEYEISEAITLLKEFATANFRESVDVAVNLASMLVNLIKTYVAQLYYQTVLVVMFVLLYLHKAQTQRKLKKLVLTLLVWKI